MAIKQPSKLTQQEIDSLNKLQQSNQQITFQFGQLSLEKLRLEEQERILKNSIENLKKEELKEFNSKETFSKKKNITDWEIINTIDC